MYCCFSLIHLPCLFTPCLHFFILHSVLPSRDRLHVWTRCDGNGVIFVIFFVRCFVDFASAPFGPLTSLPSGERAHSNNI
ncbi:hypothetical protein HDV63DRAFT_319288 [Trichoderma sp. SZMC 28014]